MSQALAKRILELFFVRRDVYGLETAHGWITEKKPVTLELIMRHLNGEVCLASHPIDSGNRCSWIGWDVDNHKKARELKLRVEKKYPKHALLFNFTGHRGFHLRVFFNRKIRAEDAYLLAKEMANEIQGIEYYPKQPRISSTGYGNFMRIPLGKHRKTGRVGNLIEPSSLFQIRPCTPPVSLSYEEIKEFCQHKIKDQHGNWNCIAINGTVGLCNQQLCPKILRRNLHP